MGYDVRRMVDVRWPGRGVVLTALLFLLACTPGGQGGHGMKVYRETRDMMSTFVSLTVVARDEGAAGKAVTAGFGEIERLARLLSWWDPESELSRVNREAGSRAVPVSPEVRELAGIALEIAERSGGAFDPTAGPLIRLWNVTKASVPPDVEAIEAARRKVGYRNVAIEEDGIRFLKEGVEFNLGGITKGYMADRVVTVLREQGITGGLVAIAGDIRAFGLRPDGDPWRVGIQDPRSDGLIAELGLKDAAVSTSGDYERFFEYRGQRYHHIMDPSTGYPARGVQSVTVVHERAVMADGLATALFVLGPERGPRFLRENGLPGLIVNEDHEVVLSPGSEDIFEVKKPSH